MAHVRVKVRDECLGLAFIEELGDEGRRAGEEVAADARGPLEAKLALVVGSAVVADVERPVRVWKVRGALRDEGDCACAKAVCA